VEDRQSSAEGKVVIIVKRGFSKKRDSPEKERTCPPKRREEALRFSGCEGGGDPIPGEPKKEVFGRNSRHTRKKRLFEKAYARKETEYADTAPRGENLPIEGTMSQRTTSGKRGPAGGGGKIPS